MKFFKVVNKKLFTLFMIGIVITFLIFSLIIFGALHYVNSPKGNTETSPSVSDISSESVSDNISGTADQTSPATKKDTEPITLDVTKQGEQYVVLDDETGEPDGFVNGVAKATIDGVTDLYYFECGIYVPTYTGDAMLFNSTMGGTGQDYYVTNGRATKK